MKVPLATLGAVAAFLVAAPSATSFSTNYYGPDTLYSLWQGNSGWAYWTTNRVWRPAPGYSYGLWFKVSGGNQYAGQTFNSTDNPFAISGSWGYNQAFCMNNSAQDVYPTTCQASY